MNRIMQFAVVGIAVGAIAAAQNTPPPPPPAPPSPHVAPMPPPTHMAPRPPLPPEPPKGRSYLGIDMRNLTPERAAALKLKEARGVEVTMVDQDAPAGKAGLKDHDVILSFNGHNIQSGQELRRMIRGTPPGNTVSLAISRDGRPMTIKVRLADRNRVFAMENHPIVITGIRVPPIEIPIITTYSRRQGVVAENLTQQLGEVFGVKDGDGVLIRSVEKGSAADKAGLRAGDVIVRVGGSKVADISDWSQVLGEQQPGAVQIGIVRDKRPQTLSMTLTERARQESFDWPGSEEFKNEMMELRRLRPQIERSMREAQEKIRRELERSRRQWQRDWQRQQRELEREQQKEQLELQRRQQQEQGPEKPL
jgi:serine protease Do